MAVLLLFLKITFAKQFFYTPVIKNSFTSKNSIQSFRRSHPLTDYN